MAGRYIPVIVWGEGMGKLEQRRHRLGRGAREVGEGMGKLEQRRHRLGRGAREVGEGMGKLEQRRHRLGRGAREVIGVGGGWDESKECRLLARCTVKVRGIVDSRLRLGVQSIQG